MFNALFFGLFHFNFMQSFHGQPVNLTFAAECSNIATTSVLEDDISLYESECSDSKIINFLHLMEDRGIRANSQTYLWLLEGCLNCGSLLDVWKLHCRILKLGFDRELVMSDGLMDAYIAFGYLIGALKVFDDMPQRRPFSWNKIITECLDKKLMTEVLSLFRRMVSDNVDLNEATFSAVLKACGDSVCLSYVEQIHARIFSQGFDTNPLVCNPLIDLYSKNGRIDSARKVFDRLNLKDSASWVAIFSGLSGNGLGKEAVLLFHQMHISGISPTPYVFSCVLSACTKIKLFVVGEQLHGLVYKGGFSSETYVCNALVALYANSGKLISAEQIFSSMWNKDAVSYNSLISGLAQRGFSDRALELFEKMQFDCFKPDFFTLASLLSACASLGALHKGKQLHSYALKSGRMSDAFLEGAILDLYVKCFDVETAREFFLTTESENVVLWNVMLVAYGQLDKLTESFDIFRQMQMVGMIPNQYTYPSILKTCTSVGAIDLGEQIHTLAIKTGFQLNVYVSSVLVDMYAKHGKLDTALGILRRIPEDDVVSWTAMISGYAQYDLFLEALKLFEEMKNRGIQSDNIGFSSAISACAGIQELNLGRQIHAQSCIFGYSDDLSIANALVSFYAKCGKIQEAHNAFQKTDAMDNISWNALISGFSQSENQEEALQVFSQMNRARVESNLFTFGSAVSAAANLANIKQGGQIHAMIIKTGYDLETEASNALISLYAKCGSIGDAKKEFSKMSERNEISWNAMITGYSQHGFGTEALSLFKMMKQQGVIPSHVTFLGVLSACSHVGLLNEGLHYFESMIKEHGLLPWQKHYVCVIDLLSRAGKLTQARKFIEKMPIKSDSSIWRTLLSASIVHKNIEIGEFAAQHLLELEPEDSATYVLLSNLYAVVGNWVCRDQTRQLMKQRGVRKEPGQSWIEVNNSFHAFFVGDRLHPLADKIYEHLADLNKRATEIGYKQECYNLLNDDDQRQEDPTVHIHSEKIAIAFGLLNITNDIPIRVFKNLRVCRDCHNWIKYVSKLSNRVIVVRDAYRFHHVKGGICSCRDYW